MLPVLPTASGEARRQPSRAFFTILHKEILWKKSTPGTDEAALGGKAQKATGKRNDLFFTEQVQRCTQARTGSRLALDDAEEMLGKDKAGEKNRDAAGSGICREQILHKKHDNFPPLLIRPRVPKLVQKRWELS